MYVRIVRFEGADAAGMDAEMANMRAGVESGDVPDGLKKATRLLALVDREQGTSLVLVFCETEDDLRTIDETMNAMSPSAATSGRRASVEMYEVALDHTMG